MKPINIFILNFFLLLFFSCSKDSGNYEYREVNRLTILDPAGDSLNNKKFDINPGDSLYIEVKVKASMPDFNFNDISYLWVLDKDTLGRSDNLKITADAFKSGANFMYLYVRDNKTKLEYSSLINVYLNQSISKGAIILAKDQDDNSILFLKSSLNQHGPWFETSELGKQKLKLGKHPIAVDLENFGFEYPRFVVVTKEGPTPIIYVDLSTMEPYVYINGIGTSLDGGNLHPTRFRYGFVARVGSGYILDNGKVRYISNGFMFGNAISDKNLDYDFGENAISYDAYSNIRAGNFLMGYDKNSKRILLFQAPIYRKNSFTTFTDSLSTDVIGDMEFVGSGFDLYSGAGIYYGLILRKGTQVSSYVTNYTQADGGRYSKIRRVAVANMPNIEKTVNFHLNKFDAHYYYALGRTIYRFAFLGLNSNPYFTLPDDGSGDIVCWNFDKDGVSGNHKNIGIATYNPQSSEKRKGSYYHYSITQDPDGKPLTLVSKSLYKIEKAVSISLGVQ